MLEKKEISNTTMTLMVSVALLYDLIQFFLQPIPIVGQILSSILITPWAFLTFYIWFKFYGRSFMTPKRALAMGAGIIIELIPILNALPGWTVAVLFLIGIEKAEKIAQKILGEGGLANKFIKRTTKT